MEKKIIFILSLSILSIVCFINFNDDKFKHVWNLIYYFQYYILVGFSIWILWVLFTNKLIRILTIPIGVYYAFHLIVNAIEIFRPELKAFMYTTKTINYILALAMGASLFIMPLTTKKRKK